MGIWKAYGCCYLYSRHENSINFVHITIAVACSRAQMCSDMLLICTYLMLYVWIFNKLPRPSTTQRDATQYRKTRKKFFCVLLLRTYVEFLQTKLNGSRSAKVTTQKTFWLWTIESGSSVADKQYNRCIPQHMCSDNFIILTSYSLHFNFRFDFELWTLVHRPRFYFFPSEQEQFMMHFICYFCIGGKSHMTGGSCLYVTYGWK